MSNHEKTKERNLTTYNTAVVELPMWLLGRVFLPALPILMPFILEFFVEEYEYTFPNQSVLIIAFVFPLITMTETSSRYSQIALACTSLTCLIMFLFSLLGEVGTLKIDLSRLYSFGLWLFFAGVVTHIVFKLIAMGGFSIRVKRN